MALLHVKTKGKWKDVSVDPRLMSDNGLENFICFKELTSYELIDKRTEKSVKAKSQKKKKKTKTVSTKNVELEDEPLGELGADKKKKKKTKKKVKKQKLNTETSVDAELKLQPQNKKERKHGGKIINAKHVLDVGRMELAGEQQFSGPKQTKKRKQKAGKHSTSPKKKRKKSQAHLEEEEDEEDEEEPVAKKKKKIDMTPWSKHFVPDEVLEALADLGFSSPMPIQSLVLSHAIRDRLDIIGAAETGSGKTLAFGIPLLHHILEAKKKYAESQVASEKNVELDDADEDDNMEESEKSSDLDDEEVSEDEQKEGELNEWQDSSDDDLPGEGNEEHSEEENNDEDEELDEEDKGDDSSQDESGVGESVEDPSHPAQAMGCVVMDDEEYSDGEYDLPPGEEDLQDVGDGIGCVQVFNDVDFGPVKGASKKKPSVDTPLYALVLAPTRELAIQVRNHIAAVAKYTDIKVAVVVGGMAAEKQERILKKCPEIVVATPGRLWELVQQGVPHLTKITDIHQLVIDEADRMVEKGHFAELLQLLDVINNDEKKREKRQTFVFSATLTMVHSGPNRPMKKKKKKMTTEMKLESLMGLTGIKAKPKVIDLTAKVGMAGSLTEARIMCAMQEKDLYLYYLLQQYPGRTLVFTNTKDCVRRLVSIFNLLECSPLPLHADMHQSQRLKNLDRFRDNARSLLLATDVAARGLDIPGVEHVIHYQIPKTTENYVHRSGRTARANKEGLSILLMCPQEMKDYQKILRTLKRDEDLPVFPVEAEYLPGLKVRVAAAQAIDKEEHKVAKLKHHNLWFERAAREMDIELDEEELLHDLGDSQAQADHHRKVTQWKFDLRALIRQPILPKHFSGKYPTKSGKFEMPYMKEEGTGSAVTAVKKMKKSSLQVSRLVMKKNKGKFKKRNR